MFDTHCTKCGASNQSPPHYKGKSIKCNSCGDQFIALEDGERPFKFHCTACGGSMEAQEQMKGGHAFCPHCNEDILIAEDQVPKTPSYPPNPQPPPPIAEEATSAERGAGDDAGSVSSARINMQCPKCDQPISIKASRCPYCRANVAWQSLVIQSPIAATSGMVTGIIAVGLSFVIQTDLVLGAYKLTFGADSCGCCGSIVLVPVLLIQAIYYAVGFFLGYFIGLKFDHK